MAEKDWKSRPFTSRLLACRLLYVAMACTFLVSACASPSRTPSPVTTLKSSPTVPPVFASPSNPKPWLAWKPVAAGQVAKASLAAPWTGGGTADVSVYTPPGYDPKGSRSYPVIYEAPTGLALWSSGGATTAQLDALIYAGTIPAVIVVYISEGSPPHSPSECVDSYDGKQQYETFISKTVVQWVDGNYRTIVDPRARAIMGMSEGGFCAAMLATRHPDVFSVAMSFSGYFTAGGAADDSKVPYGKNNLDDWSPALLVAKMSPQTLSSMYFIVVANSGQDFFGPEAASFDAVLKKAHANYLAVDSPDGHGWDEVGNEAATVLAAWAAHTRVA